MSSGIRPAWLVDLSLGLRRLRGGRARSVLLAACVALAVAARVAVGSFTGSVDQALGEESRALIAADVQIKAGMPLSEERLASLGSVLPPASEWHEVVQLSTMASQPDGELSKLVQLVALPDGYPFYGNLSLLPGDGEVATITAGQDPRRVWLQADLLIDLDVSVGDEIELGDRRFQIAGVVDDMPGMLAESFAFGPRVVAARADLADTGLFDFGYRARFETLVKLPPDADADAVAGQIRDAWQLGIDARERMRGGDSRREGVQVRSFGDADQQLGQSLDGLAKFLRLTALVALLLGGIGVAAITRAYVMQELDQAALIVVLGAGPWRVVRIAGVQIVAIALIGAIVGALLGVFSQMALVGTLAAFFPVPVPVLLDVGAIAWGVALGPLIALIFGLAPVMVLLRLRPLAVLRDDAAPTAAWAHRAVAWGLGLALLTVLAWMETGGTWLGPVVVLGLVFGGVAVGAIGHVALMVLARLGRSAGFGLRHGLANLYRPGLHALPAVIAIALVVACLTVLLVWRGSLLDRLDQAMVDGPDRAPSLFVVNVLPHVRDDFVALTDRPGLQAHLGPMVAARLTHIKGEAVKDDAETLDGEDARRRHWVRREQRLSYRDDPELDEVVSGAWFAADSEPWQPGEVAEASLELGWARDIGVGLGDRLTFSILGEPLEVEVTSIRQVDWLTMRPNFFVLIEPAALRERYQLWFAALVFDDPAMRQGVQRELVREFPEISVIDIAATLERVRGILSRVVLAILVMAGFALAAGMVVLVGMVLATAGPRAAEAALLRALGAGDKTLSVALIAEFAAIGLIAALLGVALGLPLVGAAFDASEDLHMVVDGGWLTGLVAAVVIGTAVTGFAAGWRALRRPPLVVLREE